MSEYGQTRKFMVPSTPRSVASGSVSHEDRWAYLADRWETSTASSSRGTAASDLSSKDWRTASSLGSRARPRSSGSGSGRYYKQAWSDVSGVSGVGSVCSSLAVESPRSNFSAASIAVSGASIGSMDSSRLLAQAFKEGPGVYTGRAGAPSWGSSSSRTSRGGGRPCSAGGPQLNGVHPGLNDASILRQHITVDHDASAFHRAYTDVHQKPVSKAPFREGDYIENQSARRVLWRQRFDGVGGLGGNGHRRGSQMT